MRKSNKIKSGDIVYYDSFYHDYDNNEYQFIGIYIGTDINKHRPLFICPNCSPYLIPDNVEYETVINFLNIKTTKNIHYYGFKRMSIPKDNNTGINIRDLDQSTLDMILSDDLEIRNLTLKMLINQKKNGTL